MMRRSESSAMCRFTRGMPPFTVGCIGGSRSSPSLMRALVQQGRLSSMSMTCALSSALVGARARGLAG